MERVLHNICILASGYPSEYFVANAFVETLVNAIVDQGVQCTVIAPQSLTRVLLRKERRLPYRRFRRTPAGNEVEVISPKYFSASAKTVGVINTAVITLLSVKTSIERAFRKLHKKKKFDAIYGHFIFESGIVANYIGHKYGIPAFFAYGENTTYTIDRLGEEKTRELLKGVAGVVAVSTENKRILLKKKIVPEEKIGIFPNAIDTDCFYPRDRMQMRQELGFPQDAFIVAFVGRFLDVKGPDRVSAAIESLNDDGIYSIFIGDGPLRPTCRNILHCGFLQHNEIPRYLSAADVFVLPTKAEGCCNAIIEAMACGLPVISSNLPFNADILQNDRAILLDPTDIGEIARALFRMKNDETMRTKKAAAALETAHGLSIWRRAESILDFLNQQATK